MLRIRTSIEGSSVWWQFSIDLKTESIAMNRRDVELVAEVMAEGPDLAYLLELHHLNLPTPRPTVARPIRKAAHYYGDMAKYIVGNLRLLGDES
jgi:hypothetical protein